MDIKKYIASGILELYVAGTLSVEENLEVQHYAIKYPEIQKEIETIEAAILELTSVVSPGLSNDSFKKVKSELDDVIPFAPTPSPKRTPWISYLGWAASLIFAIGMLWMYLQNDKLESEIKITEQEIQTLEEQIIDGEQILVEKGKTEKLLKELRNKNVNVVALAGQNVAPESYAKVYWNKPEQKVYVDAQGLPKPPAGFTYQVWSLKLEPLAPTSIGLLDDFANNETSVFELENVNESEAFGITLEPEGGSESPNLDQLYTLGAVGR
ncbi:anti-sigma factor [Croceitalea rosinachiae]|uniref:Anti-sigma factor n=1 Tax=Croceitalea rosinachiae TaxID=3075596 RepID=A0ABU3AAA2_9FLAO|nr:anti-sigma factor [Croceitalea sp. F388]MDT0607119.1 anti-sigma factor [Croceitalea sp. F388]